MKPSVSHNAAWITKSNDIFVLINRLYHRKVVKPDRRMEPPSDNQSQHRVLNLRATAHKTVLLAWRTSQRRFLGSKDVQEVPNDTILHVK